MDNVLPIGLDQKIDFRKAVLRLLGLDPHGGDEHIPQALLDLANRLKPGDKDALRAIQEHRAEIARTSPLSVRLVLLEGKLAALSSQQFDSSEEGLISRRLGISKEVWEKHNG